MSQHGQKQTSARRLSELRSASPVDATLENLIRVITIKLDLCARLPIFEYEAGEEGASDCAAVFTALAAEERTQVQELVRSLHGHIERLSDRFSPGVSS